MKKLTTLLGGASVLALTPALVLAQDLGAFDTLVTSIGNIIARLTPIVFAAAVLFFFYGVARFILAAGDEEKKDEGKNIMIYGIIALFVMASVFGIINLLQSSFGVGDDSSITPPSVNF